MKPETQINHLVHHIGPLANCLANYRPSAKRIHIRRDDWKVLHENPDIARTHGFTVYAPDRITYSSFELIPIDTHRRHTEE